MLINKIDKSMFLFENIHKFNKHLQLQLQFLKLCAWKIYEIH